MLAVEVVDGEATEADAEARVELVGQADRAAIQRPGHGHGLEDGAGFENAGGNAVETVLDQGGGWLVRIKIRQRCQRNDLTGIDIHHHASGGDGLVATERIEQLLVHHVLHAHVDR